MAIRQARQRDFLTTFAEGRSGRRQFWNFYAFVALPSGGFFLAFLIDGFRSWQYILLVLGLVWVLLFLVPLTAATARRFHDIGWSGWWSLGQLLVIGFTLALGLIYPQLAQPARPYFCVAQSLSGSLLARQFGLERYEPPTLTSDQETECDDANLRIADYEARVEKMSIAAVFAIFVAHTSTLAVLTKPSQRGPNQYGPNPHEVTT